MDTPFHLHSKTILVTGASSGIGCEICAAVSSLGGKVIATGRNHNRLQKTLSSLSGEGHQLLQADLLDAAAVTKMIEMLPPLDGVVHSAGILDITPFKFIKTEVLEKIQKVNYEAPVLLTQQLLKNKRLQPGSSLVFIASISGMYGAKGHTLYSATKGALLALTPSLALELAPSKIRVNCISPGLVRTPLADRVQKTVSAVSLERHEAEYPLGFGKPDDVALAVVFLLSPAARWITGTNLILDGGYSCH